MERVHSPSDKPYDQINYVALAIKTVDDDQRHIGILFRDDRGRKVTFLHLAFHLQLRIEAPNPTYWWIDPAIDPRRLRHLAGICRQISAANGSDFPYGFSSPNDWFDEETLERLHGPSKIGLTCSTFILAVFRTGGLMLLDHEEWPHRDGDEAWQRHVIGQLEEYGAPANHIAAVQKDIGAVRVRPEEVGAAAALPARPPAYQTVITEAERLLAILKS